MTPQQIQSQLQKVDIMINVLTASEQKKNELRTKVLLIIIGEITDKVVATENADELPNLEEKLLSIESEEERFFFFVKYLQSKPQFAQVTNEYFQTKFPKFIDDLTQVFLQNATEEQREKFEEGVGNLQN